MVSNLLKGKRDNETKKLLKNIIISTHKLLNEKMKQDEIDHKIYDIVLSLADYNKPYTRNFFKDQVNPNSIKNSDYETLKSILSSILSDPTYQEE